MEVRSAPSAPSLSGFDEGPNFPPAERGQFIVFVLSGAVFVLVQDLMPICCIVVHFLDDLITRARTDLYPRTGRSIGPPLNGGNVRRFLQIYKFRPQRDMWHSSLSKHLHLPDPDSTGIDAVRRQMVVENALHLAGSKLSLQHVQRTIRTGRRILRYLVHHIPHIGAFNLPPLCHARLERSVGDLDPMIDGWRDPTGQYARGIGNQHDPVHPKPSAQVEVKPPMRL